MHTFKIIAVGLVVLAVFLLIGRLVGGSSVKMAKAALYFIPVWLIGASINMYIGVSRAGYSVADEAPILGIVFVVPALIALAVWKFAKA